MGDVKMVNVSSTCAVKMSLYLFQHGMTPLMNAAYKGKAEMCELLLAQGADVNSNYHEHQVSTFSKIVNSIFIVKMLLKLVTLYYMKLCCGLLVVHYEPLNCAQNNSYDNFGVGLRVEN